MLSALLVALPGLAQFRFDGKVAVPIPAPPAIGERVVRVAVAPNLTSEAAECTRFLITRLQAIPGLVVTPSGEVGALPGNPVHLSELPAAEVAALNKRLGGGHLVRIKVLQMRPTEVLQSRRTGRDLTTYSRTLQTEFRAQLEVVNLETGRHFDPDPFNVISLVQTEATNAQPPKPSEFEAHKAASDLWLRKAIPKLFPYADRTLLNFHDEGGLKSVRKLAEDGHLDQALEAARKLSQGTAPAAQAHYDIGVLLFLQQHFTDALIELKMSETLDKTKEVREAITACQKAIEGDRAVQALQ